MSLMLAVITMTSPTCRASAVIAKLLCICNLFTGLSSGRVALNLGAGEACESQQVERGICPRAL